MTGAGPRRSTGALLATLVGLCAAPATGQEAYTYIVRDVAYDFAELDNPPGSGGLAIGEDRTPLRVVQGAELTWVVPEGDSLTLEDAVLILSRNAPVRPGSGPVLVRGWDPAPAARYDTFDMALQRGDRDRSVAGRAAHHYRLQAVTRRAMGGDPDQHYEFTADLWIIPDVPHSWAPFGYGTRSLPRVVPRLRDRLDARLSELGLVGRAVIRTRYTMLRDGERDGSRRVDAFEISALERAETPPAPGPVVDRSVVEAIEERLTTRPSAVCAAVTTGEAPEALVGDVPADAVAAMLADLNDKCSSPELYFAMLEGRLRSDPDPVCAAAASAPDARGLAEAVFTEAQRSAFLELMDEGDRTRFHAELRRYCEGRR